MAISLREAGAYAADAAVTTLAVTLPTHAAGDMLILRAACKPYSATLTCETSGWNPVGTGYANGATANGNGVGSVMHRAFYKIATSASEPSPTITSSVEASPIMGVALSYQCGAGEAFITPVGDGGGDATLRTSQTCTIQSHVSVTAGDMVDFFLAWGDNYASTSPTITQTGVTYGTVSEQPAAALSTSSGNDGAMDGGYRLASSGTSSAAAVVTATFGNSEQGGAWQTRLRIETLTIITPSAISSAEAFGTATLLKGNVNITVSAIDSAEAFGTAELVPAGGEAQTVYPSAINAPGVLTYKETILADSPVGYWRLGEPSGTNANDESTNANDGTYYNTPSLAQASLLTDDSDTSVLFTAGSLQYVEIPNISAYQFGTNDFTIEFWVKGSSFATSGFFVTMGASNNGFEAWWNGTMFDSRLGCTSTECTSGTGFKDNVRHHVVIVVDRGATMQWYVDGATSGSSLDISARSENINSTAVLYIARRASGSYQTATIDEVALYATALTSTQISNHYSVGTTGGGTSNFGTPTLTKTKILITYEIESAEAFGTADLLPGNVNITVSGIDSAEVFGTAELPSGGTPSTIYPSAIDAPGEGVGLTYAETILAETSLVGYWPLDEADGTTAYDALGSKDGTYYGTPSLSQPGPLVGDASTSVALVGTSSQYVGIANDAAWQMGTGDFSYEFWLNTSWASNYFILECSSSGSTPSYDVTYDGDLLTARLQATTYNTSSRRIDQPGGQWKHVVVTYDRDGLMTLYVNGIPNASPTNISSSSGTSINPTGLLYIGRRYDGTYMTGTICQVAVYKGEALSASKVAAHYAAGWPYPGAVVQADPHLYYRLGEASGTTAAEEVLNLYATYGNTPTLGATSLLTTDTDTAVTFARASSEYAYLATGIPAGSSSGAAMAVLVKWTDLGSDAIHTIVRWGAQSTTVGFHWFFYYYLSAVGERELVWQYADGTNYRSAYSSTWAPTVGQTYHIVASHDYAAETVKFYVDGELQYTADVSSYGAAVAVPVNQPTYIASYSTTANCADATLDEVVIFDHTLSQADVTALYEAATVTGGGESASGTPTLTKTKTLIAYEIESEEVLGTVILLPGNVNIIPTAIDSAEGFGTPELTTAGVTAISPSAIASAEVVPSVVLAVGGVTISPTGIASSETFGTATIATGGVNLLPTAITSAEAIGTATLLKQSTIIITGIASAQAFGTPQIARGGVTIVVSGIASAEALPTPVLLTGAGQIVPTGISSGEGFGTAQILKGGVIITITAIASAQAFGQAVIRNSNVVLVTGVATGEAVSAPLISLGTAWITPSAIASAQTLGTPGLITGAGQIVPSGISSVEVFGTPTLAHGLVRILPTGITTGQAFGTPVLYKQKTFLPTGIASTGALGTPITVKGTARIVVSGINSEETFGQPYLTMGGMLIAASGITSAQALGLPILTKFSTIIPEGVASAEVLGWPVLAPGTVYISPESTASVEVFGVPRLIGSLVSWRWINRQPEWVLTRRGGFPSMQDKHATTTRDEGED